MIDIVTVGAGGGSIAWISPEGTLKVGPRSAGADPGPLCYGRGGTRADRHRRARRASAASRRTCSAARSRSTSTRPRPGSTELADRLGLDVEACATGILEISRLEPGQRHPPDHRQARPRRPRLHDGRVRRLRAAAGLPADRHPRPAVGARAARTRATCRRSGCSPSTCATTTCGRCVTARRPRPGDARARCSASWSARPAPRSTGEGFAADAPLPAHGRPALLRPGVRGAGARCRTARSTALAAEVAGRVPRRARAAVRLRFRRDAGQRVEWVNLRVSGIGPITPPDAASNARRGDGDPSRAAPATRRVFFEDVGRRRRSTARELLEPGDVLERPGGDRGVRLDACRCTPASPPAVDCPRQPPGR